MARVWAPTGAVLGALAIIAGILFQAAGAAAVVYCSVIGAGILLVLGGGVVWVRHRRSPGALAA